MDVSSVFDQANVLIPRLKPMVNVRPQAVFRAKEFSVAWNAVPVIAFSGFPKSVIELKSHVEKNLEKICVNKKKYTLADENMGSKWPKVSLGALRNDRELSLNDAVTLRNICDEMSQELGTQPTVIVEQLHLVVFECRSLEKHILSYPLQFRDRYRSDSNGPTQDDLCDEILKEHEEYVKWVLGGFSRQRLKAYWNQGLLTGKGKEKHYRGYHVEATLVAKLEHATSDIMCRFMEKVDGSLPGMYCWFSPDSWHITIRALRYDD